MSLDDLTALTVIFVGFVALVQSIRWILDRITGEVEEELTPDEPVQPSVASERPAPSEEAVDPPSQHVRSQTRKEPSANPGRKPAAFARFMEVVRQRPAASLGAALLLGALVGRSASRDGDESKSRAAAAEARAAQCGANLDDTKQACRELADAASIDEPIECW